MNSSTSYDFMIPQRSAGQDTKAKTKKHEINHLQSTNRKILAIGSILLGDPLHVT